MKVFGLMLCLIPLLEAWGLDALDYAEVEKFTTHPLREISVIVTKEGYYPKQISIFEGEKIRFFVTTTEEEKSCLTLPEKDLFMAANPGRITEKEVLFKKAGRYEFYCPANKIRGRLTVLKKKDVRRDIASKVKKKTVHKVWRPKDF